MKISFNPSNSNKNILDLIKNNKDIIFDLKGHSIFARGVEFKGTDTNTWRPVVDNLTSDSTTSSLSAKQGKVLKALIDGKSNSDHNHDGRYVRYYAVTTLDCNNLAAGLTSARISATNAAHTNHSAYLYISDVGTPFQIQIPDSSIPYIYKRYYGSGKWSGWFKLNAGYADSAGSVAWANVTGKPSSYTPSAHTHAWNSLTHSSATENQAILTNGKANGWKLQTLNIARWDNAANNAHSHANKSVLDGITSALVNSWNTAYNFVSNITGTDTDKVINKWEEIVNFLAGITEDNKLNTLLNSKLSIQQLSAKDILTTKTNNALFWVDTKGNASTITTGPFTDHPYALLSVTNYNQNAENHKSFYRSRLAFSSAGDIKVASCHHEYEYQQDETWYNVLTSKNSGINGSTIKLNGTSITVYSSGTADGRYVKKSGDTMQGVLTIDTTNFEALTIKRNDDANGASIQFRGKSSVYGYIGLNNSTKDKQFLRWSSDISRVYTILDTSSTYISNGKGVINGTTITQVDNATNSTNSTNARKLVNWYSARPTSLNAQFGDGSLRIFYATSSTTEGKPAEDSHILHLAWDNTGGYDAQLAVHTRSGKVSTRAQNGGTWQPWKTLAFTTDIPSSLKNPYSFNVFGVVYDGSAAKTVTTSNFISQVNEDTSTITDGTMLITSYASNSGFADTNAVNVPYKRKAIHLWEYIKAKTDSLYATKGHNHDGRYVRAFGTSNDNIDSDWGQSFKTFDPIPLGTPPEKNPNISLLSIGENFNRRKQLAFIWNNDNIYYRRHIDSGFTNWRRLAFANEIPTSLKNPYALTISLNGTSQGPYDGSAAKNINITPGSIGAAVSNHSHDYLVVNSADDKSFNSAYHNFQVLYADGGNGITGKPANVDAFGLFKFRAASGWSGQMLLANGGSLYIRSSEDAKMTNTLAWKTILDSSNYSGILDSRYYTESEVNSLLSRKLDRVNLTTGSWNPRGWNLAADYHYNGGDLSISENNGKMYVSVDGCFWQNEGQYRVLDTSDIGDIRNSVTLHQYLSATDVAWYPLVWGGNAHYNTSDSTGAVYKSYDKLSWQTSSQTLYATNIQTNNIKNLSIGGGIYWNPYVESASDNTDAASITLVRSGVAGGTTLVLSQMNDTNDTIQFKTNTAARLYHNSYPILTTQNTYVSNNKGYINGLEITQVNNADTLDNWHKDNIQWTGYITSSNSLSSYWFKMYQITVTGYQYNDITITFLVSEGYSKHFSIFHLKIRQNGTNHSGNYNLGVELRELVGNLRDKVVAYYNNSTGDVQLWGNPNGQYNTMNYTVLKKTTRIATDSSSLGILTAQSFSSVQTPPSTGYTRVTMARVGSVSYSDSTGSVHWNNVTNKPSTFNPAAHTHTVFKNNLMIKGTNGISDSASIHLGIGDSDTGFKWISDGVCQIYANNVAVGQWTSGGMNWFKNLTVNGNKVWNAGNDGSGSGLDSDLVDGLHASRFPIYYNLNMSSTSNHWYKLGTARISESDNIMIHIYSGDGWNSNAYQNAYATLMIKTGYNPNGGLTREFGATMVNHHHSNMTYKLISPSNNTVDIWVKIPWGFSSGWYSIHGEYSSYTHSGASQSAEPTGNAQTGVETLTNAYTSSNVASATKLATPRTIWGQSFDGTGNVSGSLSEVGNIHFKVDNSYDIGSDAAASRYIYTHWLGAKSGQKLELGANNSGFGQGLCIDTNLNVGIGTNTPTQKLDVHGNIRATGQIIREGSGQLWVTGRNGALLRETSAVSYHTLWSLKTTDGSWDFGEYNAGSDWNNIPVLSYITDSNYNSGNNATTYQIKFPLASGTVALTSNIPNPTNYYWANVKISASSSTTTSPTVHTLTATRVCAGHNPGIDNSISCSNWFRSSGNTGWYNTTYQGGWYMSDTSWIRAHNGVGIYTSGQIYSSSSIRMSNILLEHTDEINNSANGGIHLNYRNSGNVSLCYGGGNVGIGTTTPSYKLDVNGQMRASGFHHASVNSDNYMLLAGGGYKSFGGDDSTPIFLGCLDLYRGGDGTISSSFYCLGYSVPFTYTRGGNYCKIIIPDTTRLSFYIIAATASVNYSGGGMDTWTGYHRGSGAWWLHCYAFGWNEVRVKGFCQANKNNDSWWGGNPLWNNEYGANRITVCIFGHVKYQ